MENKIPKLNSLSGFINVLLQIVAITVGVFFFVPNEAFGDFKAGITALEKRDYLGAYQELLPLAEKGDAEAQMRIGQLFLEGLGVLQDPKTAAMWFQNSAKQGNADAQAALGTLHLLGRGVQQSFVVARNWFLMASEKSHAVAQFNLGMIYESGLGVEKDTTQALLWYTASLKNGHDPAFERLRIILSDLNLARPINSRKLASEPIGNANSEAKTTPAVPVPTVRSEVLVPIPR